MAFPRRDDPARMVSSSLLQGDGHPGRASKRDRPRRYMQDGLEEVSMNEGQTPADSMPPQVVPPATRLGAILGWSLPSLSVVCFISLTAQQETTLRMCLLAGATLVSLFTVPGLLYAGNPALLGGPLGRLLRLQPALSGIQGGQRRRHPVTFYQGVGWALFGVGVASFGSMFALIALVPDLLLGPVWWLLLFAGLLWVATLSMGFLLVAGGDPVPHWRQ